MGKYKNKLGWTLFYNVTHKQNMETWCIILISLCILATLSLLCNSNKKKLHPHTRQLLMASPPIVWARTNPLQPPRQVWAHRHPLHWPPFSHLHRLPLHHTPAHQALVQNGVVFADRPPALTTNYIISRIQQNISSASYGLT